MDWKALGSTAMNAIAGNPLGAIGGLVSSISSIGQGKRQAKRQKELMRYQDKLQDENYARELADKERLIAEDREYNSIGAQTRRAKEAGVSPLAALGVSSGNSISAQSPSSGAVSVPSANPDPLSQGAVQFMNSVTSMSKMAKEQAEIKKLQQETATEKVRTAKADAERVIAEMEKDGWTELRQKQLDEYESIIERNRRNAEYDAELAETERQSRESKIAEIKSRTSANVADTDLKRANVAYFNELVKDKKAFRQLEVELRKSDINLKDANRDRLQNLMFVDDALAEKYKSDTRLTDKQREYVGEQIGKIAKEREKMDAEIASIKANTSLTEYEKQQKISETASNYIKDAVIISSEVRKWLTKHGGSPGNDSGWATDLVTDLAISAVM